MKASIRNTGTILDRIADRKKERIADRLARESLTDIRARALAAPSPDHRFQAAINRSGRMSLIAEVKKASPSKGLLCRDFRPAERAASYLAGGAQAISVLTEEDHFLGSDAHLRSVAQAVPLPLLQKDFVIHESQIYEARSLGASAVLLIAALLDDETAAHFMSVADELDLDVLFEVHNLDELVRAIDLDAQIIGINNRDLKTFHVDIETTLRLARIVPAQRMVVSESGFSSAADVARVYAAGARCILVGETLMTCGEEPEAIQGRISDLLSEVPV